MPVWSPPPPEVRIATAPGPLPASSHSVVTADDLRKVVIKRKWLIVLGALIGIGFGLYHALATTPQYEAVAKIHVDLSRSTNIGIEDVVQQQLAGGSDTSAKLQTQLQIMQSETVAMEVLNSLDLYRRPPFSAAFRQKPYTGTLDPVQRHEVLSYFSGATKIQVLPNTEMVEIRFRNQDPAVAMMVANGIVDAYLDRDLRARFEGTTRVSNWLSQQLTTVKKQVEDAQKDLAKFQRSNNLVALDSQGGNLVTDSLRTVMLAAFATGSITFNGVAASATGDVGVFKSFLDWIFSPLVAVAVTCFLVTPRGTVRRKLTGVAALTLAVLLIVLGRRVIFYTVLETVFFARIAGFRLQGSFLKKLFTFALVLGFIVAGTLSFMLLRIAGYGSGPSGHKALGDRIELAVEWVREGTALERTLTTSRSNVQTRTFMLGFFASVLEGSSSRTPGLGVNTIGLMQLAIPSVLYPAKDKFYSEELMTDRLFGFGYIDEANSLMTNGAVDFGLIGAILYPIAVAAFLRTSLELVSGFMDQFSMLILVLSAIYFALAPETTITAVVDLVLHGVLFSAGILLFVALPRFRLRN